MYTSKIVEKWGFDNDPFEDVNAENEENLHQYFLSPPYFNEIVGNPKNAKSSLIFGGRGHGKSSIYKMIKYSLNSSEERPLIVEYTNFSKWDVNNLENVNLSDHIKLIIGLSLEKLVESIENTPEIIDHLSIENLYKIQYYIFRFNPGNFLDLERRINTVFSEQNQNYLDKKTKINRSAKGMFDFFRRRRIEILEETDKVDDVWAKRARLIFAVIMPRLPGEEDLSGLNLITIFKQFTELVVSLGFSSIYLLIDKVDETNQSFENPQVVAKLLGPIAMSLEFMELQNVATKIFLPIAVKSSDVNFEVRFDRIASWDVSWNLYKIREILEKRLLSFSNQRISSLKEFINLNSLSWEEFEYTVLCHSALAPRNLLRLLRFITAETFEYGLDKVNEASLRAGISKFSNFRTRESYELEEYLRKRDELLENKQWFDSPENV